MSRRKFKQQTLEGFISFEGYFKKQTTTGLLWSNAVKIFLIYLRNKLKTAVEYTKKRIAFFCVFGAKKLNNKLLDNFQL